MHGGVKATLTELRSHYWVIRGRQLTNKIIRRCSVCRRHEGKAFKSRPPPALPSFRVQTSRPFSTVGIDFAGPLHVRNQDRPKTWICLFSCCSTRAVHLELVPDLTVDTFIRGLRRFCARRGVPEKILSDNAQTFRAANQALQNLFEEPEVRRQAEGMKIQWQFITEKAPWQGGFYESMVKSAKRCLRKTIGKRALSFDELQTLLTEVEAVLNSRPLSYLSEDDLEEPLTPAHLLTGHRILSLPDYPDPGEDPEFEPTQTSLSRRMSHLANMKERFWNRWKEEYLKELREHHRTLKTTKGVDRPVEVGEAVIIYDETLPRGMWRLGRVESLVKSTDGEVRAARVRVSSQQGRLSIIQRPIQHLHPLEIGQDDKKKRNEDDPPETPPEESTDPTSQGNPLPTTPRTPRAAATKAKERLRNLAEQDLV